jgi:transcriptional antiterminator
MDIRKIIRIHKLLLAETTGNPKELANRLNVSERSIYNYIAYMKTELNAPIAYEPYKQSYYYKNKCEFNLEGYIF